jgi:hypothetical protein
MTLADLLAGAASNLAGSSVETAPDGTSIWTRSRRPFAMVSADGGTAEFGLDPAVAAAAIRTPDVIPSLRGGGWVAFAPSELDDHAADRAVAWFASAHRLAGPLD